MMKVILMKNDTQTRSSSRSGYSGINVVVFLCVEMTKNLASCRPVVWIKTRHSYHQFQVVLNYFLQLLLSFHRQFLVVVFGSVLIPIWFVVANVGFSVRIVNDTTEGVITP